jgi:hypothetical protein
LRLTAIGGSVSSVFIAGKSTDSPPSAPALRSM